MDGLKVAKRDPRTPPPTTETATQPTAPKPQTPAHAAGEQAAGSAGERCHHRRLLGPPLADNIAPWHAYAQARAIQAQAPQPMDGLKVAKRDPRTPPPTTETATQPTAPKPQTPAHAAGEQAAGSAGERCHHRRLLGAPQADNVAPWHGYALVRAIQARTRQPMDSLKVAKSDTKTPQPTAEAPRTPSSTGGADCAPWQTGPHATSPGS